MIICHLVTFIKHMSVRFLKFMSCKNAERGISSGALLFAYGNSTPNEIKLDINISDFPKNENGLTQLIRMEKSIRHIRVKKVEGLYCLCEIKAT